MPVAVHNIWDKDEIPQPVSIKSGNIEDNYEIMEMLGEGAFGVVYRYFLVFEFRNEVRHSMNIVIRKGKSYLIFISFIM